MNYKTNWKPASKGSLIVSWSYAEDGTGVVLLGVENPLKIEQHMEILNAVADEEGLDILAKLGIDPVHETLL